MKVVVIGPVAPFRGGISRHTGALARAIGERPGVALRTLSFSRLYPRRLYPGESDRDPDLSPNLALDPSFTLDALDPRSWRRVAVHLTEDPPDLVVMPAWTFFVAPCLGWIARRLSQAGIAVAMIVHNAEDHEAAWWTRRLGRYQLSAAARMVTHNHALADRIKARLPGMPIAVHPHPSYDDYPEPEGLLERRADLELLCFGLVRRYKGLEIALRAVAACRRDVRLSVVGEFWEGRAETEALIRELGLAERVELVPRYVSDAEASEHFARADAVLAPYLAVSGSGVLALAQHYGRPVVASDLPGF
ncbi:MAG: glycosyltransferase, partial [Pseudomonadota bacterium]